MCCDVEHRVSVRVCVGGGGDVGVHERFPSYLLCVIILYTHNMHR